MKRTRIGISEDSQFTIDEIEVAGILILFCHSNKRSFLQWGSWGSKRRRSAIRRDEISTTHNFKLCPLDTSASENDYELEHGGMGLAPPPARRLPHTLRPNSKNARVKKRPRKRTPKKKTHKELMDSVDELSLENERLIKEVEQMRKANQELKDCNVYMKSQLALFPEQRQEQSMPYPSQSPSFDSDTKQKTETTTLCDDFQRYDGHEDFEKCSGSSALGSACDKPQRLGRPMYPCLESSPESSFGSDKDGAMLIKGTVYFGFLDLNASDEVLFGTNISKDLHDQMPM